MTRTWVVVGFAVAFAAGLMLGATAWRPMPGGPAADGDRPRVPDGGGPPHGRGGHGGRASWLAQQLDLTPEQRQQMDAIWSDTARDKAREHGERRAQLRRDRDAAIAALIPEADRPRHQRVLDDFAAANAALDEAWRRSFEQAVERTKAILTPEQRQKYEAILARQRQFDGGPGRGRDRGRPPRPPTTQ